MSEIFFILQLGVLKDLPFESVVEITGTVHARKDGEINQVRERERAFHMQNICLLLYCEHIIFNVYDICWKLMSAIHFDTAFFCFSAI